MLQAYAACVRAYEYIPYVYIYSYRIISSGTNTSVTSPSFAANWRTLSCGENKPLH